MEERNVRWMEKGKMESRKKKKKKEKMDKRMKEMKKRDGEEGRRWMQGKVVASSLSL